MKEIIVPKSTNIDDLMVQLVNSSLGHVPIFGPLCAAIITENMPNTFRERIIKCLDSFKEQVEELQRAKQLDKLLNPFAAQLLKASGEIAAFSVLDEQAPNVGKALASLCFEDRTSYENSIFLLKVISNLEQSDIVMLAYYNTSNPEFEEKLIKNFSHILSQESRNTPEFYTRRTRLVSQGLLEEYQDTIERPSLWHHSIDLGEGEFELDEVGKMIEKLPPYLPKTDEYGYPVIIHGITSMGEDVLHVLSPPFMEEA